MIAGLNMYDYEIHFNYTPVHKKGVVKLVISAVASGNVLSFIVPYLPKVGLDVR